MKAPKIAQSMSERQAKEALQSAVNKLADIYTAIGCMTIEQLTTLPFLSSLHEEYTIGPKFLDALCDDEIPF